MKKKRFLTAMIVVIVLLLPLLFKEKNNRHVNGPKLSEVSYTEISFTNQYDNIKLSGMLFLPNKVKTYPLAVIIQGSGTSNRNNPWYLSVAKHLQHNGIGVLLPDKRGSEKSEGSWVGATLNTLATDTESAIDFIKNESQVNYSEIGIIGMSQGGWIAPIVGSKRQDINFIINMSGATVSTDEQLLFEEYNNIAPYTYSIIAKLISPLTTNNLKKKESIAPLMGFDPIPFWKETEAPVFIAYGENDTNCPVNQSINRIKKEKLNHIVNKVYPDGGHGITGINSNEVNINFLNDMTRFIHDKKIDK